MFGALLPTEHPFLYTVAVHGDRRHAARRPSRRRPSRRSTTSAANGITPAELERAKHQLRARLVFENDSVTNIAHQLGYFETVADVDLYHRLVGRDRRRHPGAVADVAAPYLRATNRTVGWFKPCRTPARGGR